MQGMTNTNCGSSVPPGWKIERFGKSMLHEIVITAPNGYTAVVSKIDRNPENVLYMLAEALLATVVNIPYGPDVPTAPYWTAAGDPERCQSCVGSLHPCRSPGKDCSHRQRAGGATAAAPALKEIELNIIRFWPDGMPERLEHVWKDVIGYIPNYKLYDLQRVLAEFGFVMKVYEKAPAGGVKEGS